jgi:hypothetical protein
MFDQEIRSSLDKDGYYVARAQFFYADEDVFFRLNGRSWNGSPGAWEFERRTMMLSSARRLDRGWLPASLADTQLVNLPVFARHGGTHAGGQKT